ncbi:MAG: rod shape-determining protein MreD [Bacteroides sp.]|nr:rod shape-determining protein MreD [Bacteroides sp.]
MIVVYINRICWLIGLVLLQVLVLNNVSLGGLATPFLYIYFILKFSTHTSRNELMLWAFLIGLLVDVFSDTPGMNAAATVFAAFSCPLFLRFFSPRDNLEDFTSSIQSLGFTPFLKYAGVIVLLHHTMLFIVESFSFYALHLLLLRIVTSTLLTLLCILALEGIRKR